MTPITISINPSYLCNFRCKFCYLTPEQLADKQKIGAVRLEQLLNEVTQHTTIAHIDLYGGEIALLSDDYFAQIKQAIRHFYHKPINIITNLSRVPKFFLQSDIQLSVSFDFDCRERYEEVYRNMATIQKPLHVLVLASKCLLNKDVNYMIMMLNTLLNVKTVEIKPYSTNQANQQEVSYRDHEEFVKRWITSPIIKRFSFINEQQIAHSLAGTYNAFSDDHVYITPTGKFAVLDFDNSDNEKFTELERFTDYIEWTRKERNLIASNPHCSQCKYVGHCLTEHYRWVKDLNKSCNGYKFLLQWYDNERMENPPADV
jgi:sulfatase maturation enzyme AslB (radical SAM superfamily)